MSIQTHRSLLWASVAALLPFALPVTAQTPPAQFQLTQPAPVPLSGVAIEVTRPLDMWLGFRQGVRIGATALNPAGEFVRGCNGYVADTSLGLTLDVTEGVTQLVIGGDGEALTGLVVATPDGLFQCALPAPDGAVNAFVSAPRPGRYVVLPAVAAPGSFETRLIVTDRPVSGLEIHGLRPERLGTPRAGQFTLTAEAPRQWLTENGSVPTRTQMAQLSAQSHCPGYSDFSAADAVVSVTEAGQVSFNALSERDLTLAVITPSGEVLCNDDAYRLNPGVSHNAIGPGDYLVFVGAFSDGPPAAYRLFAGMGEPDWAVPEFRFDGEPVIGSVTHVPGSGARLLGSGRVRAEVELQSAGLGGGCYGVVGAGAPDVRVTVDTTQGPPLSFYATSNEGDLVIAVRSPSGSWACADDSRGLDPAVTFPRPEQGDYQVFVGSFSTYSANAAFNVMLADGEPDWELSTAAAFDFDPEPEIGRIAFGEGSDPRVIFDIRPSRNPLRDTNMRCAGHGEIGNPDLVVSLSEAQAELMFYMVSDIDGVLMVVTPGGRVLCNDDFEGLNPGIALQGAEAGDYAIFAGSYAGEGGAATLGVTRNSPLWVMDREH